MTNPTVPTTSPTPRILMPAIAIVLFFVSPFLLLFGGFLGQVNAGRPADWAIFQTMLGTVMFWIGVVSLMSAIIIAAVRSIAQQHLDVMLRAERAGAARSDMSAT